MSIVVFQNLPKVPQLSEREWYQPVRVETLSGFADAANNLAAVKGAGHFVHRFHWGRDNGGIIQTDPGQLASITTQSVFLPVRSPFSTHFTWSLFFQGHRHVSGSFVPKIEMAVLEGLYPDGPGANPTFVDGDNFNDFAIQLTTSNQNIPEGGRVERRDADGVVISGVYDYPILETRGLIVRSEVAAGGYPTSARALNYNTEAGNDDFLTIMVRTEFVRPIQLSINEISPILVG